MLLPLVALIVWKWKPISEFLKKSFPMVTAAALVTSGVSGGAGARLLGDQTGFQSTNGSSRTNLYRPLVSTINVNTSRPALYTGSGNVIGVPTLGGPSPYKPPREQSALA
jgi:hypothetical protein